ncbi:GLPGLI family protein [Flavobacterium cyclinae]|uniref:GLPGLI family protein n=1 Tax=Flavobacterium cyclinae TaxID=2895947 RepID=UPI001E286608|nr:GLPGLI family protein [Flavobacterium cyclinae]UGS21053.1 GLPGLI family protein [Flavobacterium cyclinae]
MKKLIYIIPFLIICCNIIGQNTLIKYSYESKFTKEQLENNEIAAVLKDVVANDKNINLELVFNDTISIFRYIDGLNVDDFSNIAKSICGCGQPYIQHKNFYYTNNDELMMEKNSYVIKDTIKKNWQITNETKNIDGLICYKATLNEIEIQPNGMPYEHNIIAWFCPSIPSSFGPIGFGGLPGTILILETNSSIFKVKEIIKNNSERIVNNLKGKIVTKKEFDAISYKSFEEGMFKE